MANNLQKITISSRNYGKLDGIVIFLTDELYKTLENAKGRDGVTRLRKLETGRAIQGLKHLIAVIKESNDNAKIILNLHETKKVDDEYFINYDEYRRKSQARFFPLYRERGFDAAKSFLNSYFPDEFEYEATQLKESEIKKVSKQFSQVLGAMSDKNRNKVLIIEEATRALKKQKRKNKALRNAFEDLRKQSNLSYYQESLDELKARLTKDYPETRGKNSWQRWIYANNWLFGTHYLEPMQKEKIGFDNIPDYLFPTLDGFLDILEIKRPSFDVVREDTSHVGSYAWCPDTNKAIGQVVNYIQEMERYQSQLTERINEKYGDQYGIFIYPLKPRACILVGTSDSWNPRKKKAFRTLNYSLHGIEVLTFSDLINRGESIISMISRKQ